MSYYRAADFGRYGFEVMKVGRGEYRALVVDRNDKDREIICENATNADHAIGLVLGMRAIIWHIGTVTIDALRKRLARLVVVDKEARHDRPNA